MDPIMSTKLRKISNKGPLGARVYKILREAITMAELPPGTWLHEDQLTKAIGVSRTPLREAFKRLQSDGLITIIPRKGAHVVEIGPTELDELFEAREIIETRFFIRAARNMKSNDFLEFQGALAEAEEAMNLNKDNQSEWEKCRKAYLKVDRQFHDTLIANCGNRYWSRVYHNVRDQIEIYGQMVSHHPNWFGVAISDHYAILNALLESNFSDAKANMTKHIRNMRKSVSQITAAAEKSDQA